MGFASGSESGPLSPASGERDGLRRLGRHRASRLGSTLPIVAALVALGCKRAPDAAIEAAEVPVAAEAPPPAPPPAPREDPLADVVRALSAHDGEPDCAAVTAGVAQPAPLLLAVVERVSMPPTAPMRAAGCLLTAHTHDPAVAEAVLAWTDGAATRGLARLVAAHLEALPLELAVAAATRAHAGPWWEDVAPAVAASLRPEVRAVSGAP